MSLAAALLLVAAQAAPEGGLAPGTIRLSELRDLDEQALVHRMFGPLAAFPYVSLRPEGGIANIRLHASAWFWSRPRGADRPGVCVADRLIVQFRRVGGGGRDDPLFQPHAFDLQAYYSIENRDEALGPYTPAERPFHEREAACAERDPRREGTPADSAYQLVRAIGLVEQLGQAARAGSAPAPMDCRPQNFFVDPPADEAECLAHFATLGEHQIGWVSACPPRRAAPGGCIRVMTFDRFVEFDLNLDQSLAAITVGGMEDLSQIS